LNIVEVSTTDSLVPVNIVCKCQRPGNMLEYKRKLPIRFARGMVVSLNGTDPETLLLTYWCHDCKTAVIVRARHVVDKASDIAYR